MSKKKKSKTNRFIVVVAVGTFSILTGAIIAYIPSRNFSVTVFFDKYQKENISIVQLPEAELIRKPSGITGLPCATLDEPHRPVAVMLAGDQQVRPLSGIARAGMVVEMPVVTWGINRFMAVFSCGGDFDIGSIRSSRDDFIPLAAGLGAVYGHWGGSYLALNELSRGVINNINAIPNPFGAFYRKSGILAPDNGFSSVSRLLKAANSLGYKTNLDVDRKDLFQWYSKEPELKKDAQIINIGYPDIFEVRWEYDLETKTYLRFRGKKPEIDKIDNKQANAATIIIMETNVVQRYGEYNDVRVTGEGNVTVFTYGLVTEGRWKKDEKPLSAPLKFLQQDGQVIKFAKGPVWLEIIQTGTPVTISTITKDTLPRLTDK